MAFQDSIAATINSVVNQSDIGGASSRVVSAIKNAAAKTGVDFSYLLKKATQESGLDPTAKAATSSASGLFQFTSQTWLQMVKNDGAQYGLGSYASQITTDSSGHLTVSDAAAKQAILALRNDPTVSAEMAASLDKENAAALQQNVGGKIGGTELYLAHFLGAGGASSFLSTLQSNPSASGAAVLPDAAAANPAVFYSKSGQPRTLEQIYQHFAEKFDDSSNPATTAAVTQVASAAPNSAPAIAAKYMAAQSSSPAALQVASLYAPAPTASSVASGGTNAPTLGSGSTTTSGASTLFTAMVLGQMNGSALDPASTLSLMGQSESRRKNPLTDLTQQAA